jgi:hypothetical protein
MCNPNAQVNNHIPVLYTVGITSEGARGTSVSNLAHFTKNAAIAPRSRPRLTNPRPRCTPGPGADSVTVLARPWRRLGHGAGLAAARPGHGAGPAAARPGHGAGPAAVQTRSLPDPAAVYARRGADPAAVQIQPRCRPGLVRVTAQGPVRGRSVLGPGSRGSATAGGRVFRRAGCVRRACVAYVITWVSYRIAMIVGRYASFSALYGP